MTEHLFTFTSANYRLEWTQDAPRVRSVLNRERVVRLSLPWVQYLAFDGRLVCVFCSSERLVDRDTNLCYLACDHGALPNMNDCGHFCMGSGATSVVKGSHSYVEAFWMTNFNSYYMTPRQYNTVTVNPAAIVHSITEHILPYYPVKNPHRESMRRLHSYSPNSLLMAREQTLHVSAIHQAYSDWRRYRDWQQYITRSKTERCSES